MDLILDELETNKSLTKVSIKKVAFRCHDDLRDLLELAFGEQEEKAPLSEIELELENLGSNLKAAKVLTQIVKFTFSS